MSPMLWAALRGAKAVFRSGYAGFFLFSAVAYLPAQETSVRPKINEAFENPDVATFTARFEREGRDAFDHRKEIVEACQLTPGMMVADIGAGTGLFTRLFAPLVGSEGKVYAVDISEKFVKHVETTSQQAGLKNVIGVVCAADSVKLPPESIDLAFICDTYHHFEFPFKTMHSIHRALRPGGQVVLIDFHRVEGKSTEWVLNHVRAGQEVFTGEIVESGFRQVDVKPDLLAESYFIRFEKTALVDESARGGWKELFDGKTIDDGWKIRGGFAKYKVEEGAIVGTTSEGSPNTFLCKGPFGDFELQFEVLCDKELNSGVQIRSHVAEADIPNPSGKGTIRKGTVYGYQCEIAPGTKTSGNFWDEARHGKWWDELAGKPGAETAYKVGEWNRYRIVAQGDHIRSWINDVPCADFHEKTDASGVLGLQVHGIGKGKGPYQVRWRKIRLRELKPGEKVE